MTAASDAGAGDGHDNDDRQAPREALVTSPHELVDAFKRSGRFDTLRADLLRSFLASSAGDRFVERIEDIISRRIVCLLLQSRPGSSQVSSPSRLASASSFSLARLPSAAPPNGALAVVRSEATDEIRRELERHTAYERAEQDLADSLIPGRTDDLEDELDVLLHKIGRGKADVEALERLSQAEREREKNDTSTILPRGGRRARSSSPRRSQSRSSRSTSRERLRDRRSPVMFSSRYEQRVDYDRPRRDSYPERDHPDGLRERDKDRCRTREREMDDRDHGSRRTWDFYRPR